MFEHNGIIYYSENEFKKEVENSQKEYKKRLKTYATIRIWLLIILVVSLAGNLHLYFLYNTSNELLYLSYQKNVILNEKLLLKDKIQDLEVKDKIQDLEAKDNDIYKKIDKIFYNNITAEVLSDISKKNNKIESNNTSKTSNFNSDKDKIPKGPSLSHPSN